GHINNAQARPGKQPIVALGVVLARRRPAVEMGELGGDDGGLERVETKVSADDLVMVFRLRPVSAEAAKLFGPLAIVGDDHAGVAGGADDLRRKERETPVVDNAAGPQPRA